ncbi:MAG: hypothetical protein WCC39_02245 [Telluria sp.]
MKQTFYMIEPVAITDAMLVSSPLTENDIDDAPLYNPGTTYAAGARVRRSETHRIYESAGADNVGNTPELNVAGTAAKWIDLGPTNRWAMFDGSIDTASVGGSSMTVVLHPGAVDSIYGVIDADQLDVSVCDAPGGNVVFTYSASLEMSAPADYDEYFWAPFQPQPDFLITGLDPYYGCEVTITLSKAGGNVQCPGLVLGYYQALGATQKGAKVKPKSYSTIKEDGYGNTRITRRRKSTDLTATAWVDRSEASYVNRIIQRNLDTPAVFIGSDDPADFALRCFGIGSGEVSYDFPQDCQLSLTVSGVINVITDTTA